MELIIESWLAEKGISDPFKGWWTANQTLSKSAKTYECLQIANHLDGKS
jgi:hypothetical protein